MMLRLQSGSSLVDLDQIQPSCSGMNTVTPELIRPHLKAMARNTNQKRKKISSMILTDIPVIETKRRRKIYATDTESSEKNVFQDSSDSDVSANELCDDSTDTPDQFQAEKDNEIRLNDFVIVSSKKGYEILCWSGYKNYTG